MRITSQGQVKKSLIGLMAISFCFVVTSAVIAATIHFGLEAESGSGLTNASVFADSTASGGQGLNFIAGSGFQANCINNPSSCGYPDATNTGVTAEAALVNSGSITVSQDGAIVENKNINGQIVINANNVTIRNTRITTGDYYPIDYFDHTGLVIEDTEIIATSYLVTSVGPFSNYTARRVEIRGSADGFKAGSNVLIEDCYIHSLGVNVEADTHNDGVQATGSNNITLRHNTIKLGDTQGANAALQIGIEFGNNNNWLVENNLLDGGGWIINASETDQGANRIFRNNRFTKRSQYGVGSVPNTTWTGNFYDDSGAAIN